MFFSRCLQQQLKLSDLAVSMLRLGSYDTKILSTTASNFSNDVLFIIDISIWTIAVGGLSSHNQCRIDSDMLFPLRWFFILSEKLGGCSNP